VNQGPSVIRSRVVRAVLGIHSAVRTADPACFVSNLWCSPLTTSDVVRAVDRCSCHQQVGQAVPDTSDLACGNRSVRPGSVVWSGLDKLETGTAIDVRHRLTDDTATRHESSQAVVMRIDPMVFKLIPDNRPGCPSPGTGNSNPIVENGGNFTAETGRMNSGLSSRFLWMMVLRNGGQQ